MTSFVSGLRESIKADVQTATPETLSDAVGLAHVYRARNMSQRRVEVATKEANYTYYNAQDVSQEIPRSKEMSIMLQLR